MENYKQDIINTRVGCLGSSDAALLAQITNLGYVPKTAYKRMAVLKGLIPQEEIPRTAAMKAGDDIEMAIYEHLSSVNPNYESNPLWVSEKYSRKNVKLISHPDIVMQDNEKKNLYVYEVKTTKYSAEKTRQTYKAQLYVHHLLAQERAVSLGRGWHVKVFLCHYSTDGLDVDSGNAIEFDTSRLTITETRFTTPIFNAYRGMEIVEAFLKDFDYYTVSEIVEAQYLPESVNKQFVAIADVLREIKRREEEVEAFKARLYDYLNERGIKSVKCEDFSFSVVQPTENVTVDYKAIFENEIEGKTPYKARRLKDKYKKVTKRKGYVTIKVQKGDK